MKSKYFLLQVKRFLRLFPVIAMITLLLFGSVFLLASAAFSTADHEEAKIRVRIGAVGEYENTFLEIGIAALQDFDASRFSVELIRMDKKTAARELQEGKISAYIIIPEGFVEGAGDYSNEVQLVYVTGDGAAGISTVMMNEVAAAVSDLLTETQNSIYGMQRLLLDNGADPQQIPALGFAFAEKYFAQILRREDLYEIHITGQVNTLTFRGYFLCALTVLFVLLQGISSAVLLSSADRDLWKLLRARGIPAVMQVLTEYMTFFLFSLGLLLVLAGLVMVLMPAAGISIPELTGSAAENFMSLLPGMVKSTLLLTSFAFLIYELFPDFIGSVLAQTLAVLFGGYAAGCFYPISYLPHALQRIGNLLPAGIARQAMESCLSEHWSYHSGNWSTVALYTLVITGVTVLIRAGRCAK